MVGKNDLFLHHTGKKVQLHRLTNKLGYTIKAGGMHADMCYNYEYSGKIYIIILGNNVYLKYMKVNLLTPFMIILDVIELY